MIVKCCNWKVLLILVLQHLCASGSYTLQSPLLFICIIQNYGNYLLFATKCQMVLDLLQLRFVFFVQLPQYYVNCVSNVDNECTRDRFNWCTYLLAFLIVQWFSVTAKEVATSILPIWYLHFPLCLQLVIGIFLLYCLWECATQILHDETQHYDSIWELPKWLIILLWEGHIEQEKVVSRLPKTDQHHSGSHSNPSPFICWW